MSQGRVREAEARFDWAQLTTLRLRARAAAEGLLSGVHHSTRRGSGVEFGGHRPYVPGDDLRLLDRRAMARHDKPFLRELQTETDRSLRLLVDASRSMGYKGDRAPVSKLDYAAVLAGALGRVALASGDPVGLELLGGEGGRGLAPSSGREGHERLIGALEATRPGGDVLRDTSAVDRAMAGLARRSRRGAVIVLFSDLLDVPDEALGRFVALATAGRTLIAVRVLDRDEIEFPFREPLKLRSLEGEVEVETDPPAVRQAYLDALARIEQRWAEALAARGGRLVCCSTSDEPVPVLRAIVKAAAEGAR